MKLKKDLLIVMLLIFVNLSIFSQIGIGTTNPHVSSVLDMTSTTQGVLTPRMTSAQRLAILSPIEGLLVFDNEEDAFYYYNGSVWVKLEGAIQRDNYKLVKDISDLADELSGSKYVLSDSYTYEINGKITFDYPVELNGANIIGRDTGEDILENASGSTFFTGTKGGRFKDLVIEGGDNPVFNISGGAGTGSVAGYSVLIKNASSLGTISDLFSVFFEVLQVTDTDNGFDISDITSFFMDKIFWTGGNKGTFLKLSGTFGNLQIANGRVVADSGEIGVDVSANPSISVSASLSEVSFTGSGDLIKSYTSGSYSGYNFTNDWDVDCPGIPVETDGNATGNINLDYAVGSGANTTFSGTGTSSRIKIAGNTTSTNLFRFSSPINNRITYKGSKTRYFSLSASLSFQGDNNNTIFIFYMSKNNTIIEETKVYREVGENNDVGALPIVGTVELAPNDYIEVWAERYSGSGDLLAVSLNLIIR
ncbi:cell wall anchor protein [Lutibacter sp. A64]|uniref:cell wall anchor protein n=1 Tax=Lutibacter sp. A64 TaxID=2918526 RepID=UPI001F057E02|nr:cell wall anchor protein [Lutibacter sp. A64]UMB53430.1 cell wall anchor protein [Lutibacter sp. A64]